MTVAAGPEGADWIQFDESAFVLDRTADEIALLTVAYNRLAAVKRHGEAAHPYRLRACWRRRPDAGGIAG